VSNGIRGASDLREVNDPCEVRINQEVQGASKKESREFEAAGNLGVVVRAINLKVVNPRVVNLRETSLQEINLGGTRPRADKEKAINGIRVGITREIKATTRATRTVEVGLLQTREIRNEEILTEVIVLIDAMPIAIIRVKEILTEAIQIKKETATQTLKISNENIFCIVPSWRGVMGVR
jgi:hypothetical protein